MPYSLTKIEGLQQEGAPLSIAGNNHRGDISHDSHTSQTYNHGSFGPIGSIESLVIFPLTSNESLDIIPRLVGPSHGLPSNSKTSAPSISEADPCKDNSSAATLSPKDREILERPRQNQLTEMREKRQLILEGFLGLGGTCDDATADHHDLPELAKTIKTVKEDVQDQLLRFNLTSISLIQTVQNSPLEETELSVHLHTEVSSTMESISQAVKRAPRYLKQIFKNFRDKDDPNFDETTRERAMQPQREARDVLASIDRHLNQLEELAQPFLDMHSNAHKDPNDAFLPMDSHPTSSTRTPTATATLFQCFCEACPWHPRHTAYLSLGMGDSTAPETHMAILYSGTKAKSPVWLRVVSASMAPQVSSPGMADDMEPPIETGRRDLKRRRSSDGLAPPSKLRKTVASSPDTTGHVEQEAIDTSRQNPIQFCPEYLAQHEEVEHPAMLMVDASSAFHRFYFLPAERRPPENWEPFSLHKMLQTGRTQVLWKVQVARLIAEAALHFDCPEIRCKWGRDDIVFYRREPVTESLGPFLKVEIERLSDTTHIMSGEPPPPSGRGQTRRLLNLAFTLLQVGLFKPIEPPLEHCDDMTYRDYIVDRICPDDTQITGEYNTVVRRCTKLAEEAKKCVIKRESFQEKYHQDIISPLRKMETNLLGLQRRPSVF